MEVPMDPHEQKLLTVFNSYDVLHRGSLDRDGLMQLCNSLQLEEQGLELIRCLLTDSKLRVTFHEFKEGLLTLLGNVQNARGDSSDSESSDREVSPKFVYGSKKYGRRSRPESIEQDGYQESDKHCGDIEQDGYYDSDKHIENKALKSLNKVQRSNSQSDVLYTRKRKTNGKLKRCTSFPGNDEMERQYKYWNKENREDEAKVVTPRNELNRVQLQTVINQLGVGSNGFLTHLELAQVCEAIRMHDLSKDLLKQLTNNQDKILQERISIDEVINIILQQTNSSPTPLNNTCITEDSVLYPDSKQHVTLGPNGTGMVTAQALIELWENVGITSAGSLLQELGFTQGVIGVVDLAMVLDEELRALNDSYTNVSPHIVLLQATIALYQCELQYLKSLLEQLCCERDKLRLDISEANQRASLLAQEVDDNHAKMEKSTQNQVRLLEQKHSDTLRDLTLQFSTEKEQLSSLNAKLEHKINVLETEEAKLRSELLNIQSYNCSLEKENQSLVGQVKELGVIRTTLADKVNLLENECQKLSELERERDQLEPVLKKMSLLSVENAELRDKNDELYAEINTLTSQVCALRSKLQLQPPLPTLHVTNTATGDETVPTMCEGVGLGAIKRRVDSPSSDSNLCGLELESPRLGKVRRCYQKQQQHTGEVLLDALAVQQASFTSNDKRRVESPSSDGNLCSLELESPRLGKVRRCYQKQQAGDVSLDALSVQQLPFNSNESGFDGESDCLDSSLSFNGSDGNGDEMNRLQARIALLEQVLAQNSIALPAAYSTNNRNVDDLTNDSQTKAQLIKRCKALESIVEEVQTSLSQIVSVQTECQHKCDLINPITQLSDKLRNINVVKDTSDDSYCSAASTVRSVQTVDSSTETQNEEYSNLKKLLEDKTAENKQLQERLEGLEQSLELLGNEYENCENYWSSKLDEERQAFEREQKQNDDKLAELVVKMTDYEKQFAAQDGRLSPIDEKDCLEQQFTDLEEEYNAFKSQMEYQIEVKDKKIECLKRQISTMQPSQCDVAVQVYAKTELERKVSNLTNVVVSTNIFAAETLPNLLLTPTDENPPKITDDIDSANVWTNPEQSTLTKTNQNWTNPERNTSMQTNTPNWTNPERETRTRVDSVPTETVWTNSDQPTCSSLPSTWNPPSTLAHQPYSLNITPDGCTAQTNGSVRPRRLRKHDRGLFAQRYQKRDPLENGGGKSMRFCLSAQLDAPEQTCVVPLNSMHHLHGRLRELDQHCRHLQFILKQQQRHSESVMHYCWQQHREEMNEVQLQMKGLQEKLSRSDALIKDLFMENTYLMANNQRLEHRCHMLVQCSSESTSV